LPAIDEDIVRDLMHRATSDLHASPSVGTGIVADRRRRTARARALGVTITGLAAVTAVGVAVATADTGAGTAPRHVAGAGTTITLTAAQKTLLHLSLTAATTAGPAGRYAVMAELQNQDKRTTIIDSVTGTAWTFQAGVGPTEFPPAKHASPTSAELAAYPSNLTALRAVLIKQGIAQQRVGIQAMLAQAKKYPKRYREIRQSLRLQPKETPDDWAFAQAAYLLWNPLVGPSLRSGLFKLLASTPGVVVNAHATDTQGRAAVEISRYNQADNYTDAVYESPDGSRVLETASIHPATPAAGGLPAEAAYTLYDTYLSITWTNTPPTTDPYK
jgi:hypothetical protein